MKRKLTILGLVLALALSPAALAAETLPAPTPSPAPTATEALFPKTAEMPVFSDVTAEGTAGGTWYDHESVTICVETGLMKGSGGAFNPGGHITLAEVVTIAARINEKTAGYALPTQKPDEPWYAPALAVMAHIGITVGPDPMAVATRGDFVRILSAVTPDELLSPINTIATLPDTKEGDVLRFYNAGILTGRDAYGTFDGGGGLLRSEVCAMLARIARPALRKTFTPAFSPLMKAAAETEQMPPLL